MQNIKAKRTPFLPPYLPNAQAESGTGAMFVQVEYMTKHHNKMTAPTADQSKHQPAASPAAQTSKTMEPQEAILKRLEALEQKIIEQNILQKAVLTFAEALIYLGLSESHLYKLTSKRKIPHSKPDGKLIYFDRAELDKWRLRNPVKTMEQIEAKAAGYSVLGKAS